MANKTNTYECYYDPKLAIVRNKKTMAEVRISIMEFMKIEKAVQKEKSNIMGLCTVAYSGAIMITGTGDPNKMLENITWRLRPHDAADDTEAAKYSEEPAFTKEEWNQYAAKDGRRRIFGRKK